MIPFWRSLQVLVTLVAIAALFWSPFATTAEGPTLQPTTGRLEVVASDADGRWVRHRSGVTRVPHTPQRICALNFADELITLDVLPAAVATDWRGVKTDYLRERLEPAAAIPHSLGQWLPSFEAIAALQPDLILTWTGDQHTYDQLASIAPTVVVRTLDEVLNENGDLAALYDRLRDVALVIGVPERAEPAIAAFREHLQRTRARVRPALAGQTIAFIRARGRQWRLYGKRDDCGGEALYDGLGLQAPDLVAEHGMELDPERLIAFDADHLVVVADTLLGSDEALARLRAHPLWRRVHAVRTGNVFEVTHFEHWILSGLAGKRRMLADVVACVERSEVR